MGFLLQPPVNKNSITIIINEHAVIFFIAILLVNGLKCFCETAWTKIYNALLITKYQEYKFKVKLPAYKAGLPGA